MRKNRVLKKQIIIICFLIICIVKFSGFKSYADLNNINFNNIYIEPGISQSTIECIFQDSKGYIWIGTNDGLNRYNGYEFKVYKNEENKNSISGNVITDVAEDNKGNIWVGTVGGINKIDIKTGEISNYTEDKGNISDGNIKKIICTKDNKILVTTHKGLGIYNEFNNRFDIILKQSDGLSSNEIHSIDEDYCGNLWLGTNSGIDEVSKDFKVVNNYLATEFKHYLGEDEVSTLYCDNNHDIVWVGTYTSGAYKLNTKNNEIKEYKYNSNDKDSISSNQIEAIMRDSSDNVWIGTKSGLAKYDESNNKFKTYINKVYDKNSLIYDHVKSLMEDKEGLIWVGTYSGLGIFDKNNKIKHYKAGIEKDQLLSENMIHGIYEDDDGYLWVGTKSKGINIIDRKDNVCMYLNSKTNKEMDCDYINDITGSGSVIFAATDNGVLKIDRKNKTIKNYNTKDGLIKGSVQDIFLDNKQYLWIGTTNGLCLLNTKNNKVVNMNEYIKNNLYVKEIYQDSEGNYFLGLLKDGGLCVLNPDQKSIKYYKHQQSNQDSISSNYVTSIIEDKEKNIWIGTDNGLNKFNKKTKKFIKYKTQNGLSNNTIHEVLVDNDNNVWASTNFGLVKIDTKNNKVQNLSITDGIQGKEFNNNASYKNKNGELFFGGTNGLNSFYPDDVSKVGSKSNVLFDGFDVNDKEYSDINGLNLSENTDTITIKFFTPIYSSKNKVMYEYHLLGNKGKSSVTKDNYVTYKGLSPGSYTFEVRAIDTNGNIGDKSFVNFTIKYPFWMSPSAYIVYIILIVIIIIRHKYRMKTLDKLVKERTKLLSEEMERNTLLLNENIKLEKNKNSYFVNLSHELRTPLNVISSTNQLIMGLMKKGAYITEEKLGHYIDVSQKNCHRLLNLINNILDGAKLQKDMYVIDLKEVDIVYLVEETALTLADYINAKGIDIIIDPEMEEKTITCDPYEIERCVINLIGNAAKFTPEGGSITVTVKDLDDKVMISVQDTGVGIEEKYHKIIFDRFNQVLDEQDEAKCGSGLGLTITSHIIKLHKGTIHVESTPGEGSNFIIKLPINPNEVMEQC